MNNNYFNYYLFENKKIKNILNMKSYKNKKNNNIINDYSLATNNEINKKEQNYYLNKYHKMYGNNFNDIELLDIFERNNYNDKYIMEDINNLLSIGNVNKYDNHNNYNTYERNPKKSKSKSRGKKNKYEKRPFQKCIEIPSDYAPPPKKEEEEEENNNIEKEEKKENINDNKNDMIKINKINEKNNNYSNDILLAYKENFVRKLKNSEYTYKSNKSKKDVINSDNYLKSENNAGIIKNKINFTENNKNIKIENNSPGPECLPYKKNKINKNIDKDIKKYMRDFFGNMKNYTNNIRRANWEKSPDFNNRRDIILDSSPDKNELYDRKVLTYKKGFKNYYSNENNLIPNKKNGYKYLKIENKINDIFISACYDNPQRDQYLKIINEKKKQNPDKIIEFLIPQFPSMFPPVQPFQNMYTSYNQYNPYMNMYMMPPSPQFSIQNPNPIINNIPIQNINNNINYKTPNNNNIENNETPESQDILTPTQTIQLNNNNQINVKINNTPNPNALLLNNNEMNNSKSNKSSGNISNSGNNNIEANIK